ncbi:amino acid ABC transporter substrate-binding protein [Pseudothauera nasutitermitis]|uniref:Amino acid ABC transporter substrate-binding protein n=1 Tax=Pseudothauera nasutitermitis TaxID=2565930 RepID=A0A4S4B1N9_9RHOO|nr:amino acid ABC transporter substrate-binding protein [Pseudothauera nasutitermitis]THF66065.1 amino acid ABC transporter substrate-binding protein [Pseudothauera nasutitermitis]
MKKSVALTLLSLTAGLLLSACGNNEQPATEAASQPAAARKVVVGLDDNFPPMGFRDEQNKLVGFDIDLAREAATRLGVDVEFRPIEWSAKEAELNSGRIDVLWNGLTITEERKQHIGFTSPYMENHQAIVVAANSPINTKADLAGKVVGVQEGSSAVQAVEKEAEITAALKELKKFGDNVTALMDLSAGRLDAVVLDEVVGRYYIAKRADEYRVLEDHFGAEEYGVGTAKENTELLAKLEEALNAMKQDGSAARISEQWFGKNIVK